MWVGDGAEDVMVVVVVAALEGVVEGGEKIDIFLWVGGGSGGVCHCGRGRLVLVLRDSFFPIFLYFYYPLVAEMNRSEFPGLR